jgi:putative ATPase
MPRPAAGGDSLFASTTVSEPLAARMRPATLDEFVGQTHLVGPGRPFRKAIESGTVPNTLFSGPPGCGKTTLARIIAKTTDRAFVEISAVGEGIPRLREIVQQAEERRFTGKQTILFIDELHRWSKTTQDFLLPHVERGLVTLLGASTENLSFALQGALLSRAQVMVLKPITDDEIAALLRRALTDRTRGLGALEITADDEAVQLLARMAGGDARNALTTLETAAAFLGAKGRLTLDVVQDATQRRIPRYDKGGDLSHAHLSAIHKSCRQSQPDAALYYAARMIQAGEDPMVIFRRAIAMASEDIGMADSQALVIAVSARDAYMQMGAPEGLIPMAHMLVYLATCPKSNSAYAAWGAAQELAAETAHAEIPMHAQNAPTALMKAQGYGVGYQSAHDTPDGYVPGFDMMPAGLEGTRLYVPGGRGEESAVAARLAHWRSLKPMH